MIQETCSMFIAHLQHNIQPRIHFITATKFMKQRVLTSIENLSKIVYSLLIWDNDMTTAQVCPAIFSLIFFLFPGFALSQFVGTSYIGAKMLVIQDLSYYELVYLFLGMFCQLHQTKHGGNNSVWTWLVTGQPTIGN